MWSHRAERLIDGNASVIRAAVAELVDALWANRSRLVLDDEHERVDAITIGPCEDEVDVWLTWRTAPYLGRSRVEVRLDELSVAPEPHHELTQLLDALAAKVAEQSTR